MKILKKYKKNESADGENGVIFTINNSFKNKPIIWSRQIFLSEDQYFQYRNEIMDFIKSEAGFKNLTSRQTSISPYDYINKNSNSEVLPANIRNSLSEEKLKELNKEHSFNIIYDKQHINYNNNSYTKNDLSKESDSNYFLNNDVLSDNSFILRLGHNLTDYHLNDLPVNYYLSRNDKPIFKADNKLNFKEKSDIVGSKYYISSSYNDADLAIKGYKKIILSELKDDEDFNKMTKEEQNAAINEELSNLVEYMNEVHKDDAENIKKYQAFLNSEKWGNQRLTQYIGNVDTKVEEKDFKTIKKEDPTLAKGETKIIKKGVKGKKVSKFIYEVDSTTGELKNPKEELVENTNPVDEIVLVGTKNVIPAKPIEDIVKTTKVSKEVIKGKTIYEADDSLDFEKKNEIKKAIDGEKEITTISQKGQKDQVSEKIIKESVDGLTKVGNKKIEIKKDGDITITTTTIYEVDKNSGKLINPKVSVNKSTNMKEIEDISTKTIHADIDYNKVYVGQADLKYKEEKIFQKGVKGKKEITQIGSNKPTEKIIEKATSEIIGIGNRNVEEKEVEINGKKGKQIKTTIWDVDKNTGKLINPKVTTKTIFNMEEIEDIAKKSMPWTNIEDIAKKSIPAEKIQDIAKRTSIPAEKIQDIAKIDKRKTSKVNEEKTVNTNKEIKISDGITANTEKQSIIPVSNTNVQTGIGGAEPLVVSALLSSIGLAFTKKKKED